MANVGDIVEIAFQKATPEEIKLRPHTYQTEPDVGEVVSKTTTDQYGQEYNLVRVRGRLRKVLTKKLNVRVAAHAGIDAKAGDAQGSSAPRHFGEAG